MSKQIDGKTAALSFKNLKRIQQYRMKYRTFYSNENLMRRLLLRFIQPVNNRLGFGQNGKIHSILKH